MNKQQRIIVIGGSAGSLQAVVQIIASLETEQRASVFVALHGGGNESAKILEKKLSKTNAVQIAFAQDGEAIEPGHIYVAPSDRHLMIQDNSIRVNRGPRVNRSRPAIDLLFRSAAVAYGTRTVGVLLSGLLSDGTTGLLAIERCGGITIVQDPADALFSDMPKSAMEATEVDYIKPAAEIGALLNKLSTSSVKANGKIPEEILIENRLDMNQKADISSMDKLGKKVSLGCPECGGPMWEINSEGLTRFRCHTGHSFNLQGLLDSQNEEIETTLRVALRTLEEKMHVQEKLMKSSNKQGTKNSSDVLWERTAETKTHIERLRKLLLKM